MHSKEDIKHLIGDGNKCEHLNTYEREKFEDGHKATTTSYYTNNKKLTNCYNNLHAGLMCLNNIMKIAQPQKYY